MLFLLFVHSLTARAVPDAADEGSASMPCNDLNNCRSLLNIIWSCLTTIFLCTWVSMHPNIPEPVNIKKMGFLRKCSYKISTLFKDKVPLFIVALLIPEYILAWAIRQHLVARKIVKENEDLELTPAHGFFMIMGGFHYFAPSGDASDAQEMTRLDPSQKDFDREKMIKNHAVPVHPLSWEDALSMIRREQIVLITEEEIQNTSKSDWLAKTLVLLQTGWFVMQCIARRVEHLPTTELEIITLAYAAMNFTIFLAWWNKPHNVDCPIRVFQKPLGQNEKEDGDIWKTMAYTIAGSQDQLVNLHERRKVPIFYGGDTDTNAAMPADGIVLVVGVVFGAIHCIAWSFTFPSHTETVLWRASSIAITSIPILIPMAVAGTGQLADCLHFKDSIGFTLTLIYLALLGVMYVAARFTTITIAFMNLSSLPPGAFKAVEWTIRIPHLS